MKTKVVCLYYSTENQCWIMSIARCTDEFIVNWNTRWNTCKYKLTHTRTIAIRNSMYVMARRGLCDMPNAVLFYDGSVMLSVTIK